MFSHDLEFKEFHQYISPIIPSVRGTVTRPPAHLDLHSVKSSSCKKVRVARKVAGYSPFLVCFAKSV